MDVPKNKRLEQSEQYLKGTTKKARPDDGKTAKQLLQGPWLNRFDRRKILGR